MGGPPGLALRGLKRTISVLWSGVRMRSPGPRRPQTHSWDKLWGWPGWTRVLSTDKLCPPLGEF
eukprot:5704743-Amphidinium_carterae.1